MKKILKITTISILSLVILLIVNNHAEILTRVGEYEETLDKIDYLLSIPQVN